MLSRVMILSFLSLLCVPVCAQQRFVVIDMETKVPLRDVSVRCGNKGVAVSIWDGSFLLDSALVRKARANDSINIRMMLSKPGYLTREMLFHELTDTIELLPAFNKLSEVVIIGKYRNHSMSFSLRPPTQQEINEKRGPGAGASVNVGDIMQGIENLFNYKKRKRREKVKENLERQ